MTSYDLENIALTLVADGKGILAADETVPTLTRRFDTLGIQSTERSRRTYREMLFTAPGAGEFISGVILQDETIRQKSSGGTPLAQVSQTRASFPASKSTPVRSRWRARRRDGHRRARRAAGPPPEYHGMGARFAKWRAVIRIADGLPSPACVSANAHALARYAALCQEQHLVPIVEPEVLMDGTHSIDRCEDVTCEVLHAVFHALFEQGVALEGMLLKPNMVVPARSVPASRREGGRDRYIALLAPACAGRGAGHRVPIRWPEARVATVHLNAINRLPGPETLENHFLLRPSASGPGAGGMAWSGRKPEGWPTGVFPPGPM